MQSADDIMPSLEQGVYPLSHFCSAPPLHAASPYPLLRVLLSHSAEMECAEAAARCLSLLPSQETKRDISLLSRMDARQAASLSAWLSGLNDPEIRALYYALLTLELAASMAQRMGDGPVRQALDFFIPEYLDELYRIANLLFLHGTESAQALLYSHAEIMPGRPMIACHRHPYDCVSAPAPSLTLWEELALLLLAGAEKEKLRHALYLSAVGRDDLSRAFFAELSLLSQQHLAQFSSLLPPQGPLNRLFLHEYAACYLYDSCAALCSSQDLKSFSREEREHEWAHLHKINRLLMQTQSAREIPAFPPPLALGPNKGYVRDTLQNLGVTALREGFSPVGALPRGADFFRWQKRLCPDPNAVPSHRVVQAVIDKYGTDYRFEIAPHPVEALRLRTRDRTDLGR